MSIFYILRHGHANYDLAEARKLVGIARQWVPLTPVGCSQVEAAGKRLRGIRAELIVSSPITRALQTATILSRSLNLPVEVEYDLHEWISDLTFTYDQEMQFRQAYQEMMSLNGEWPPNSQKNWEPLSSVRKRVINVLMRYCGYQRVIVVCHGVIIYSLTGEQVATGNFATYNVDDPDNL